MDKYILEASRIRDVKKRRSFLKKKGIKGSTLEKMLESAHFLDKGKKKFPRADQMKFTRESLAQATSKYIGEYRTFKIRERLGNVQKVMDVGSGIGGDAIAMGLRWNVIAVEKNPALIEMLHHNLMVYNLEKKVEVITGDIYDLLEDEEFMEKLINLDCIFFDPSRRDQEKRTVKTEEYEPPLSLISKLKTKSENICVKISPGVDYSRIDFDCDIEVISYKGEVKEVTLWFGNLKISPEKNHVIATKLPEKISWIKNDVSADIVLSSPLKYLYEPDPAFIKAHLIDDIASHFKIKLLNRKIAYLTGDERIISPILKRYKILEVSDTEVTSINHHLTECAIGTVDLKSRGVKIDLKDIHKSIKGRGKLRGIVIFTQVNSSKKAIICRYD